MMAYAYFIEKSSALIHRLLIGKGTAKQRLLENEVEVMWVLHLDIPDNLNYLRKKILIALSKKPQLGDKMSSFRHTLIYMHNSTASKIIDNIYSIYLGTKY